ncbi:MAG TPA: hypothetical protein VFW11_08135 [Cyclobacteriaceae bacterium]|nr:hypothetical protein [Cyclobacteriaceae bacterium]
MNYPNAEHMQKETSQFFLIVSLLLGTVLAFGQQGDVVTRPKKNYIQFKLGLMHPRLIDEGYSTKLLFRGTNWKFGLDYGRETNKYRFSFSAEVSFGTIETKSGNLPSDFQLIQPSLEYSRKIRETQLFGVPCTLLMGLRVSSTNFILINQPVFDNASVLSLHGAYINLGCQLNLSKKNRLQLSYRLPVVVYTNRLVWNGGAADLSYDDLEHVIRTLTTRGSFHYFEILNNVQLKADYELDIGRNTHFVAGYTFSYVSTASNPTTHIYSNELLAGLRIRF